MNFVDFLTTLLAYMAATFVIAVESTAAPVATPTPRPEPTETPIVETVTEIPSQETTAVPTATVSLTPAPVPTITPNTAAYRNLAMGDKGDDVRRLQERLIELKYLPEGSADGAYGRQTRAAVRTFQYYNGLTVDGVAGRSTQTNLFENPDVVPNPEYAEPTPEGTEAPAETPAAPATETTEAPAADTTEAPAESPAAETTEAPAAETAAVTTDAPAAETTEASAETPATETAEAPAKAEQTAPAETPAAPAESPAADEVENVNLDDPEEPEDPGEPELPTFAPTKEPEIIAYEDLAGWIVLNDSGESMQWTATEDGVPVVRSPRLQHHGDDIRVSLDDLCLSVESWTLSEEEHSLILEAQGFTMALLEEETGLVATVDGMEMVADYNDFSFGEGHYIRADFLCRALDGTWEWDPDEETLMLRIPEKNPSLYTD